MAFGTKTKISEDIQQSVVQTSFAKAENMFDADRRKKNLEMLRIGMVLNGIPLKKKETEKRRELIPANVQLEQIKDAEVRCSIRECRYDGTVTKEEYDNLIDEQLQKEKKFR